MNKSNILANASCDKRRAMRKIQVVDYDPAWPDRFEAESALLSQTLGSVAIRIRHIGSTAVPYLPAKPIIDILVEVTDLATLDALNGDIGAIGYKPKGEFGIPGRRSFQLQPRYAVGMTCQYGFNNPDFLRSIPFLC